MKKNEQVAILSTKKNAEKHTFYFKFEQNIDSHITKAGNMVPEFNNFMEETINTTDAVTNENLAATAYRLFRNFVRSSQLQRKDGFKTSQPIVVTFGIDGRLETRQTKFSINPDRMEKRMREMAELTLLMFQNPEKMSKTTFQNVLASNTTEIKLLVDKIVKEKKEGKQKKIEAPVEPEQPQIEQFEGVNNDEGFLQDVE